jgi:hypothetical protein
MNDWEEALGVELRRRLNLPLDWYWFRAVSGW